MKYIFNWISGSGGDFILALRKCMLSTDYIDVTMQPHINMWTLHMESADIDRFRFFDSKFFGQVHERILNLPDDEPAHFHSLCKFITNSPALHDLIKENKNYTITYLCTHTKKHLNYITMLSVIKNGDLRELVDFMQRNAVENNAEHCYLPDWKNVNLVDYGKVFFEQDHGEIAKLFNGLGVMEFNMVQLARIIKLYTTVNIRVMTDDRYQVSPKKIRLHSLDDIERTLSLYTKLEL